MDVMQPFYDICADPKAYARSWKARTGGKVVGTLCSYAPEELILAAGALGFRLVGHVMPGAVGIRRSGRRRVVDGRQVAVLTPQAEPAPLQFAERLGRGDLVQQLQVDVQHSRGLVGLRPHQVPLPDLLEQRGGFAHLRVVPCLRPRP